MTAEEHEAQLKTRLLEILEDNQFDQLVLLGWRDGGHSTAMGIGSSPADAATADKVANHLQRQLNESNSHQNNPGRHPGKQSKLRRSR